MSNDKRDDAPLVGVVVEVGNLECLEDEPGVVVSVTREELTRLGGNLLFCEVEIRKREVKP